MDRDTALVILGLIVVAILQDQKIVGAINELRRKYITVNREIGDTCGGD